MGGISLIPSAVFAQSAIATDTAGMHGILDGLYDEMIVLSEDLIGVGRGIGGFAALWYISSRVWRNFLNAEPIDFYPLLRPFAIGFAILFYPVVLMVMDGILKPTADGTAKMMEGSNEAITMLLKQKEEAIKSSDLWQMYVGESGEGDKDRWLKYTHGIPNTGSVPETGFWNEMIGNDIRFSMSKAGYKFKNSIKEWMNEVLNLLYEAAALCINTLRTFNRVVLAILGPLVLGFAIFDGLQNSLSSWLTRYVNVYLWLPVCNIFGSILGKIQEKMIELDIIQIQQQGDTVFSTKDIAYMIFMIIGIVGYFTVPSVAGYIVNAGGGGGMLSKVTSLVTSGATSVYRSGMGEATRAKGAIGNMISNSLSGKDNGSNSGSSAGKGSGGGNAYTAAKIGGDSK